ncbi:p21-activated protein kinase-interacting protein 1-like [Teleopsis dalmanni]|uniref:p21-activated protein kinase-interacting protein 1-like n=1 Tax=Teleopsis dalmanni TaxID=139649 RepID=UPI0018CE9DC7|nr:p21-activated protein kinase-interacting protein 1-like [Teleopsis dalmanni]
MSLKVEIIVGTYEEFLLGYKIVQKDDKTVLTQSFADKSHSATIKCVAVKGEWIATGAADDRIFIYNMRLRKQSQIILSHEGTINALSFTPDETHLLSGGDDGQMVATRLKTWFNEATWKKAHNGSAVTHICCHPSGKLALSLGSDLVLRTWNLVKGRIAYKTNLKSRNTLGSMPDCLAWSLSGDYFSISGQRLVEIWSIKTADVVLSQKTKSKPICAAWITNEACLIGLEDGNILWLTLNEEKEEEETLINAHNARVKAMCFYKDILATTSSSGEVKVWHLDLKFKKLKVIATTNIGCRPTCIALLDLEQFGEDYVLTKTIAEKQEIIVEKKLVKNVKPRGVVTIEYENEDDDIAKQDIKKIKEKRTDKSKKRRHETSEEEKDDDSIENDDDDDEVNENKDEVEDDDEVDDDDDDNEIGDDDDTENELSANDDEFGIDNPSEEASSEEDTPFKSVRNNQNNAKKSKLSKNSKSVPHKNVKKSNSICGYKLRPAHSLTR